MKLKFGNTVGGSDNLLTENDQKIDTTDVSQEEKEEQDKFLNSLTDNEPLNSYNEDTPDTSGDEDEDSEESEDEEEDDAESNDAESDDEEESEEDTDSETEDESDQSNTDTDNEAQTDKGKFDGYDTFEEYKEAQKEKAGQNSNDVVDEPVKNFNDTVSFLEANKDIIPPQTIESYKKYYESGNDAFLYGDNHLHKLNKAIADLNPNLPYQKRLAYAFDLAFKDEILKKTQKATQAKTEIRTQRVNKAAAQPVAGGNNGGDKPKLSSEQKEIFRRMNVKIPKKLN